MKKRVEDYITEDGWFKLNEYFKPRTSKYERVPLLKVAQYLKDFRDVCGVPEGEVKALCRKLVDINPNLKRSFDKYGLM
jgi:hypothetical protein